MLLKNIYIISILFSTLSVPYRSLSSGIQTSPNIQIKSDIKFCFNDKYIFKGEIDGRIQVWDINTGKFIKVFTGHTKKIMTIDLSLKGDYLISGGDDHSIRTWDIEKGIEIKKIIIQSGDIHTIKLSHDGNFFVLINSDQTVSLWDTKALSHLWIFRDNDKFSSVTFTTSDKTVAVGSKNGYIYLFDSKAGKLLKFWKAHSAEVSFLEFNPHNNLISFNNDEKIFKLWDIKTKNLIREQKIYYHIAICINHNRKFIYVANFNETINLIESNTFQTLTQTINTTQIFSLVSSKIDKHFITNEDNRYFNLWKVCQHDSLVFIKKLQFNYNNTINRELKIKKITPLQKWKHLAEVTSLAIDSTGEHILSGGWDKKIQYRESKSSKLIHTFDGHKSAITAVAFYPTCRQFISSDLNGKLLSSSISSFKSILHQENLFPIQTLAISPDGKFLALGCRDNTIEILLFGNQHGLHLLKEHTGWISSLAFTENGKNLISSSYDGTIRSWEIFSGNEVNMIKFPDFIRTFACLPKYEVLIVPVEDKIYKLNSTKLIVTDFIQSISEKINAVTISPDGHYFIAGGTDNIVSIYDLNANRWVGRLAYHTDEVTSLCFSPDGKYFVSGSKDSSVCVVELKSEYLDESSGSESRPIINLASGDTLIVEKENVARVICVANSPDGKYMISGSNDNQIRLWETKTGKMIKVFSGHTDPVQALDFDKSSQYFVSGGADKSVRLWKIDTTTSIQEFKGHSDKIAAVHFSHNGIYIVSGSMDSTVKVWERRNGRLLTTLKGHNDAVETVIFSKDDKMILSGSRDKTIRLWDWKNSIELNSFEGHLSSVNSISLSPTGKFFVSGGSDSTVKLWDLKTGKIVKNFEGHQGEVTSVTFNNQGNSIISGSLDSTVVIWEVGKEKKEIISCKDAVTDLALTPDGNVIIGSKDGELSLWRLKNKKPIITLVGFRNNEWISVTPEMYYVASENADKFIKTNINDTSYSLHQYAEKFNNPELVNKSLTNQTKILKPAINMKEILPPYIIIPHFQDSYGNVFQAKQDDRGQVISDTCIEIYANAEDKNSTTNLIKYELSINFTFKILKDIRPPSKKYDIKERILLFPYQTNQIKIKIWNEYAFSESNILYIVHKDTSTYSAIRITEKSINCLKKNGVDKKLASKMNEIRDVIYWGENDFISNLKKNLKINDLQLMTKIVECSEKLKNTSIDSLCNFVFNKSWAIVIGIDKYLPESGYRELNYSVKDAKAVKRCLINNFGYTDSLITELYNEKATKTNIKRIFDELANKIGKDDQILIYFSGHGDDIKGGEERPKGYLIPYDGNRKLPLSTCISSSEILEFQERIKSRQSLIIIDACFSGLFGRIFTLKGGNSEFNKKVIDVIKGEKCQEILTSGRRDQESIESSDKEQGIFTYYLLKGLEGEADRNKDNIIIIKELSTYLTNTVPFESKKIARKVQTPELYESYDDEGDWIFYKIISR